MTNINVQSIKLLAIGAGCLAILFVITLLYAVLSWHDDWKLAHAETKVRASVTNKDDNAGLIRAIADQHLFGKNFAKMGEVPLSNLQISVTGIVKIISEFNNSSISKAYISVAGGPSKIYQIGDTLPSGVKIYNITSQEVILENGGQLEKLRLPREQLQFKPRNPLE